MNKKRWVLVVLITIAGWGYFKLFYKSYSTSAVAKSADCIVALDIKRITNTVIWTWITTPSQWKKISFSSGNKATVNWKDMVIIPDYVLAFHIQHQPLNIWYTTLQVKDENDFVKGLQSYHFEKQGSNIYLSKDAGILFYREGSKLLVTNAAVEDSTYLLQAATELFINKEYIAKQTLDKAIAAKSHLAIYIAANNFLQEDAVIAGNFDKYKIEFNCNCSPKKQFSFTENNFNYNSNSLCTLGFTQPSNAVYGLLNAPDKDNISKALGLDMDSTFLQSNKYYIADIAEIKPRIDSAITYTYDNDFNKVEKVVLNTVREPAFNFSITGDSCINIYKYFQHAGKIDQTDTGNLFKPMPFAKSYCTIKSNRELNIVSSNYQPAAADKNSKAILLFNILLTKIPNDLLNYLPADVIKIIANIESVQLKAGKQNEKINFNCIFQKKKNDLPVINL